MFNFGQLIMPQFSKNFNPATTKIFKIFQTLKNLCAYVCVCMHVCACVCVCVCVCVGGWVGGGCGVASIATQ